MVYYSGGHTAPPTFSSLSLENMLPQAHNGFHATHESCRCATLVQLHTHGTVQELTTRNVWRDVLAILSVFVIIPRRQRLWYSLHRGNGVLDLSSPYCLESWYLPRCYKLSITQAVVGAISISSCFYSILSHRKSYGISHTQHGINSRPMPLKTHTAIISIILNWIPVAPTCRTASPKSEIQHVWLFFTRMFLLFKSLCAIPGLIWAPEWKYITI